MKFKTIILGIVMILMGSVPLSVSAAETGSIRIELPEELSGATVYCLADDEEEISVQADEKGVATLSELESGKYRIRILETQGYQFTEAEVQLPMWDETEKKMSYHITVIPKYNKEIQEPQSPKTGDQEPLLFYGILGGSSLVVFGIWHYRRRQNI